jgi:peptidyl-prolyl cis-trans isomerase A (cyclophilin A)
MNRFTSELNQSAPRRNFAAKAGRFGFGTLAVVLAGSFAISTVAVQAQTAAKPAPTTVAQAPASTTPAVAKNPQVLMKTSMGEITIELYPDRAPASVGNFLQYVKASHYNGLIFHRVMRNFMIQTGGYTRDMKQRPTRKPIELESQNGLRNDTGWVAMARTQDPNSATSQFYINTVDNPSLNYPAPDGFGYAVFGKVVKGMDVVNKIREATTIGIGQFQNVPHDPITIDSIAVVEK